jgi:translation initiation factor 4E
MIGDQLDYGDTVCGAVLSIRFGEDILSVWNRNSSDNQVQSQRTLYNCSGLI